jgi:hypothetical protein
MPYVQGHYMEPTLWALLPGDVQDWLRPLPWTPEATQLDKFDDPSTDEPSSCGTATSTQWQRHACSPSRANMG